MEIEQSQRAKWNFVEAPANIVEESGENSAFKPFIRNQERGIVREYIQNSLDVPANKNRITPVEVTISLIELDTSKYPELFGENLLNHIEACKISCDENANASNPYESKEEYIKQNLNKKITCLEISDYQTTGMTYKENNQPCDFKAGVRSFGASFKNSGAAGGSHGQGKIIGFVASMINAVYYSTKTQDGSLYGEGVVSLCAHTLRNKSYYASAFFDQHNGERPDTANEIPEVFRRTQQGTSVFILGYQPEEKSISLMKEQALRSFWMAIYNKHLIITIEGEKFDSDNIVKMMNKYFPIETYSNFDKAPNRLLVERFNPRPYLFECIMKQNCPDHKVFESSSEKFPALGLAKLYIYKNEYIKSISNDRIVCMRDREMVIQFHSHTTRKGCYGVLVCSGEGSKLLRQMENVTHDSWDTSELRNSSKEEKKKANKVLKEMAMFIDDSIKQIFPEDESTEYHISALDKYLFAPGNRKNNENGSDSGNMQDSANNPSAPISTIASELFDITSKNNNLRTISIKRKGGTKKKKSIGEDADGMQSRTLPKEAPKTRDRNNPENPVTPPVKPVDNDRDKKRPNWSDNTEKEGYDNGNSGKNEQKKSGNHAEEIQADFRVIPQISDTGLVHRIIIYSKKNYKSCSMAVSIAGADSDTQLDFSPVDSSFKVVGKNHNILTGFDLNQGKNYIDIQFEDSDFHSLKIKAYES